MVLIKAFIWNVFWLNKSVGVVSNMTSLKPLKDSNSCSKDFITLVAIGADGYCRRTVRPVVCPSGCVRPERRYLSNF